MMRDKAVFLLSGGLDSVVALAAMTESSTIILAITFDYGQYSVRREIHAATEIAQHYGLRHRVIPLPFWRELPDIPLVSRTKPIIEPEQADLDNPVSARSIAESVWIPNRNGVFINVGALYAESMGARVIGTGFNAEEAATFPDNSQEYIQAINSALQYSTGNHVQVVSPTGTLMKHEIVELGIRLHSPLHLIHSCYRNTEKMCGRCSSCLRCREAFIKAGYMTVIQDRFERVN